LNQLFVAEAPSQWQRQFSLIYIKNHDESFTKPDWFLGEGI